MTIRADDFAPRDSRRFEETKRIRRVLDLVQLIAGQPRRWLRRDLATRFEVSQRQIDKDVDLIRNGMVLDLLHAPEGYYFERLPRLAAAPLTFEQALALLLAAQLAGRTAGVDMADLQGAMSHIEAQLPLPVRDFLRRAALDATVDGRARHRTDILASVSQALVWRRKIRMVYASASRGGHVTERTVRPYGLLPYGRSWHVVAHCELRGDVRLFKADRIRSLVVTDESYAIPPDFGVESYLGDGWGLLRLPEAPSEDVELVFEPSAGRWVSEERWHPRQVIDTLADGRVRFRVRVPLTHELVRWVLGYGRLVTIVAPDGLREAVRDEARAILDGGGVKVNSDPIT